VAAPAALKQQRARALIPTQLQVMHLQAAHVPSHDGLQLESSICRIRQPANENTSLMTSHLKQIASNAVSRRKCTCF
jgi:hypothetical protein